MEFDFATAARILFGRGKLQAVAPAALEMGSRALVVTGKSRKRASGLLAQLDSRRLPTALCCVEGEPSVEFVETESRRAREAGCDLVISIGGGSAIDAGKAIAALLTNTGDLMDHLEVIGRGKPLTRPPAPFIAIPTTAGTGSEVTRNAVLASHEHKVKASLRSPLMLPRLAVVDPELTCDLSPEVTASTGLDALTQLIEPYVSVKSNPMTDGFCFDGIRRIAGAIRKAYKDGHDVQARADMALASLFGGLSLANAGLGVVHGFAAPIGGMFPAPHGAVCAAVLPNGVEANVVALRRQDPGSIFLGRYQTVARLLTGKEEAQAEDGVEWLRRLCSDLAIPGLSTYGVRESDSQVLVEKAARTSSMKGNPVALTVEDLSQVLLKSI
jgi:alcohol dehydrogenase class IV